MVVRWFRGLNLLLRFGLEICALVALGYGGWHVPGPVWSRLPAAVLFPLAGALVWAQWVAPKARRPLTDPVRLVPEWVVFGGAAAALAATGHPVLAILMAVTAAANRLTLHLLGTTTGGQVRP